jgi:hypothetical protein
MNAMFLEEISAVHTTTTTKTSNHYQPTTGLGTQFGILAAGFLMMPLGHTNLLFGGSMTVATIVIGSMATLTPKGITRGLAYMTIASFAARWFSLIMFTSITYAVLDILIDTVIAAPGAAGIRDGAGF